MYDVISIGSSTMDFFIETEFPSVPWDTPLGRAIAIPFGEKFSAKSSFVTSGGNAMNTAVTFRRQGLKTAVAIKLGCDLPGEITYSRIKDEGIKDKFVIWDDFAPTSCSVIILQGGDRSIITYQGAGSELKMSDFNFNKMKAKWWYVSLPGNSHKIFPKIAKKARDMGVKLALNPTGHHIKEGRKQLAANLKYVDFLALNSGEAADLIGIPFFEEKKVFDALDKIVPGVVAVTAGSRGATVSDGKYIYKAGIFKEKKLNDRTGAGDAFGSGFVAGLIRAGEKCERGNISPESINYAVRLAAANAASVVEKVGASEGAIRKKEFDSSRRYRSLKIEIAEIK